MKAILEVALFLEKFRNIDLCQQGLYQLQLSIYCQRSKAQPISIRSMNQSKTQDIIPGSLTEETVRSQVFLVRYADEKIKLNELSEFYFELDLAPSPSCQSPLTVQVDLCYAELGKKLVNHLNLQDDLAVQSSKSINIANPLSGSVEYLPICFPGKWFSVVNAVILLGFYDYKIPSSDLGVFASVLFADEKGDIKDRLMNEEINEKFDYYVRKLVSVHDQLKKGFEKINGACFIEDIDLPSAIKVPASFDQPDETRSFAELLVNTSPLNAASQLLKEIKIVAASTYEIINLIKDKISGNLHKVQKFLMNCYKKKLNLKFSEFVRKEELGNNWKFDIRSSEETKKDHKRKAKLLRQSSCFNLTPLDVQEANLIDKITKQPILFEEASFTADSINVNKADFHLVVLVHGFQGNSFDLRTLRNYISLVYPKVVFLESTFNESKTEGDIREMGSRLSREVISFLTYSYPEKAPKISFIGHSMGGLIIRAALPYLECLSDRMHMFLSLSTPHLGLLYSSKIVDAGMWILKKMKKSKSIKQLCFEDYPKIEGTCLYMMSREDGLKWFRFIVLVASLRDEYAPFESARIEVPAKASKDPERGNNYIQMAHNILQGLTRQNIIKLDVHFKLKKSIESMIGRSAHLQLLENENFVKILVYHYPEFFS